MVTQEQLQGSWHSIVGAVKERFGDITGDELTKVQGNLDQLVGLIQRKSGETRDRIEEFLSDTIANASSVYRKVSARGADVANQATHMIDEGIEQVSQKAGEGYAYARDAVSRRPMESLLVVAGVSVLAGVAIGLSLGSKR